MPFYSLVGTMKLRISKFVVIEVNLCSRLVYLEHVPIILVGEKTGNQIPLSFLNPWLRFMLNVIVSKISSNSKKSEFEKFENRIKLATGSSTFNH